MSDSSQGLVSHDTQELEVRHLVKQQVSGLLEATQARQSPRRDIFSHKYRNTQGKVETCL